MIESNIIKRFLVKTFMQNSDTDINKIAEDAMKTISSRFMPNESVLAPSRGIQGKICRCFRDRYTIETLDKRTVDVEFLDIRRKFPVDFDDVCNFLESITTITPFGRIVIENVFEKITQPGFGVKKHPMSSSRSLHRPPDRQEKDANPVFQEVKKATPTRVEPKVVAIPEIDFSSLQKLCVEGYDYNRLQRLLKVHSFFSMFFELTGVKASSLKHLAVDIASSDYDSSLIVKIHQFLIETIEKDMSAYGARFVNEAQLLLSRLPSFSSTESSKDQAKKRIPIVPGNWKAQTKIFLYNLSVSSENERILRFSKFTDDESIDLRLDLLCFLIDLVYFTDTVRSFILECQNNAKTDILRGDTTENEEDSKINPLHAHIGKYNGDVLFGLDDKVILKKKDNYFILGLKEMKIILKNLNTSIKQEKITFSNLKMAMH